MRICEMSACGEKIERKTERGRGRKTRVGNPERHEEF